MLRAINYNLKNMMQKRINIKLISEFLHKIQNGIIINKIYEKNINYIQLFNFLKNITIIKNIRV